MPLKEQPEMLKYAKEEDKLAEDISETIDISKLSRTIFLKSVVF